MQIFIQKLELYQDSLLTGSPTILNIMLVSRIAVNSYLGT